MEEKNKFLKLVVLSLSLLLFVISLTQECYCTTSLCGDSLMVFIFGFFGIFFGGAALTWLANPLLLISWLTFYSKRKISFILSLSAFLISISFMMFSKVIDDEAGHYNRIIGYELGYWLWISSSGVMMIGNLLLIKCRKSS